MAKKDKRARNGAGNIIHLPNGKYRLSCCLGRLWNGKYVRKSVTAPTIKECTQRMNALRAQFGKEIDEPTPVCFRDIVKEYMDWKKDTVAYNTYSAIETADKKVFQHFYDFPIGKITAVMIDSFMDTLTVRGGKRPSGSYMNQLKMNLSMVFNFAIGRRYLNESPMRNTKSYTRGKKKSDRLEIPTKEEIQSILKDAKTFDETKSKHKIVLLYPLFLMAISTGMRIGEILNLDREKDINTKTNTINVHAQLTKEGPDQPLKTEVSNRIINIHPKVLKEVLSILPKSPISSKLWTTPKGRQVEYLTIERYVSWYLRNKTTVPKGFSFHCFRHYHATSLLQAKTDVKNVSKRLGHSSVKTTYDFYAHWIPEQDRSAAYQFGEEYIA